MPIIPFKLAPAQERNLTKARQFWSAVHDIIPLYDIYTSRELTKTNFQSYGQLSIDHFIPWSFVLHDELWNLVPTFQTINSSKSNKLPNLEIYMEKFCDLQYHAFQIARKNKKLKNSLQDYLTINKNMDINALLHSDIKKDYFADSIKSTIKPLFQIAYNQGYSLWHDRGSSREILLAQSENKAPIIETQTLKKGVTSDTRLL